jgi:hypothetical protein
VSYDRKTEMIDTIFRVFSKARFASTSEVQAFNQASIKTNRISELAKLVKPRQAVSRACKHRVLHEHQLDLFKAQEQPISTKSEVCQFSSRKPQITYDILLGRVIPCRIKKRGGI